VGGFYRRGCWLSASLNFKIFALAFFSLILCYNSGMGFRRPEIDMDVERYVFNLDFASSIVIDTYVSHTASNFNFGPSPIPMAIRCSIEEIA
jgi:hypothetical protein